MIHGPASITVTGMAVPFGPNTWVMPTFLPNNPLSISFPLFSTVGARFIAPRISSISECNLVDDGAQCTASLQLDLDIHACGQIQTCQGLNSLISRIYNIYQAFVRANFKLLTRILINEWRTHDGKFIDLRRQRYRARHPRPRLL